MELIWGKALPADLIGIAVSNGKDSSYVPLGHNTLQAQLPVKEVFIALAPVLNSNKIKKYVHDLKTMLVSLDSIAGDLELSKDTKSQSKAYQGGKEKTTQSYSAICREDDDDKL